MAAPVLAGLAAQIGVGLLEKILSDRIGAANGKLAADVVRAVAQRARVEPAELDGLVETDPGRVIDAMREVERLAPELVALHAAEVEAAAALARSEGEGPVWMRAWRPAGMYLLGLLWVWNAIALHVANAVWKIALPPMPFEQLIQLSGLYMGLYMGGHTVKDLAAKWGRP
ncbi:MAG: hypothetical protein ACK4KW_14205 [Gemmobacter sp.]